MQLRHTRNWKSCCGKDSDLRCCGFCTMIHGRVLNMQLDHQERQDAKIVDFSAIIGAETAVISFTEACTMVDKYSVFGYNTMIAETG